MEVVLAGHRATGDPVYVGRRIGHLAEPGQPGPEPAYGAELRHRRELLVGRREPELDQAESLLGGHAGGLEDAQHRGSSREKPAELLAIGGALLVNPSRVDDDRTHASLEPQPGEVHQVGVLGGAQVALGVQPTQRNQGARRGQGSGARARWPPGRAARRPTPRTRPPAGTRSRDQPEGGGAPREVRQRSVVVAVLRVRMSQGPARVGRADVARPSRRSGVPSGGTAMPSYVVRVSAAHTASSESSSVSRRALRRTPAAALSQSARDQASSGAASRSAPCSGCSSSSSSSPPTTSSVMPARLGAPRFGQPAGVNNPTRPQISNGDNS